MKLNDLINWVKVIRENCEKTIYSAWQEGNLEAWTFHRGKAEALEDFANILTKVEQDLTLKELKEFCEGHTLTLCEDCPLAHPFCDRHENLIYTCSLLKPSFWDADEIKAKIEEASK